MKRIGLIALLVGSIIVGAVTLVTAAASYSVGKPDLFLVNIALLAWATVCAYWSFTLIKASR